MGKQAKPISFIRTLEEISSKTGHRPHDVFRSFTTMAACCLSMGQREADYLQEASRYSKDDLTLFSRALAELTEQMEQRPFADLLGTVHMEWGSKSGQQWGGEFYTPQSVSSMMARMLFSPESVPADRPIAMLEPACGAGGMVLAFAEVLQYAGFSPRNLRATCIDVSRTACDMCFINLTMWGIPAEVIHGNALSLEVHSAQRNFFWYMAHGAGTTAAAPTEPIRVTAPAAVMVAHKQNKKGQMLFDFQEISA